MTPAAVALWLAGHLLVAVPDDRLADAMAQAQDAQDAACDTDTDCGCVDDCLQPAAPEVVP